jgi:DNA-binding CsgD family transcriptional regulator
MDAHEVAGRDDELATIAGFFEPLEYGAAALLIEGEAGIGKTTLWRAALALARKHELRVLESRPAAAEAGLTFAALGDLLADVDPALYEQLPEPQRHALAAALLLEAPTRRRVVDQRAVGVGLFGVLRALQPVVVAIDDAQWTDPSSAAVLAFAWRRLRDERVALVLAVRAAAPSPFELEAEGSRAPLCRIPVGPLSVGAMHRAIRSRTGLSLPRPTLIRVHHASRGNPFYALELARFLGAPGVAVTPGTPLPLTDRLAETAELRLAALPPAADDDVLLAIALLGEGRVDVLESALGNRAATAARVADAVAAGVLERDGRVVRFAHPLLAEAVHARSAADDRRHVHRLLADAPLDAEQRARHLALAADGPDREAALALDAAADRADGRGAPASAAELSELALALTPPEDADANAARTLATAQRHVAAGAFGRARDLLAGLLPGLPRGSRRASVLVSLGRLSNDLEVLAANCEEALGDADDDAQLSVVHALLGSAWPVRGGSVHALEHGRLAVEHALRSGDRALTAAAQSRLAVWETWAGRQAEARLDGAIRLRAEPHRTEIFGDPSVARGLLRLYQGRLDEARTLLEEALARADAYGDEIVRGDLHGRLAELECRAGRWSDADRHAAACHDLAEQLGFHVFGAWVCFRRALVDAHLGRVAETRAVAQRGIELSPPAGEAVHANHGVLAFLELGLGEAEAAATRVRPLLRWLADVGRALAPFPVASYAVEALVEVGDGEAAALVEQLEREGWTLDSPFAVATARRLRALLDAAGGDFASAVERLELALAVQERYRWPFEQARTLLALGDVRRRAKEKRAARTTLEHAAAAFDELGAPIWAAKARASLARISGRTAAPSDRLTPTERRVAELVVEGRTNKEVAAALFVAPRTVEWNLSKVYTKLGVRSRTELARKLADERAHDVPA